MQRDYFKKVYATDDLLDADWRDRLTKIEVLSKHHHFIPTITFSLSDAEHKLTYQQVRLSRVSWTTEASPHLLTCLAKNLDELSVTGFIHGDINFKNVFFDGSSFRLIDLEPSLRQRKLGRETLMYTPPYISLKDYQNQELTQLTDKIGFYFLCVRLRGGIDKFSPLKEMKRMQSGHSVFSTYAKIEEYKLNELSYEDILTLEF
jgi:hypothetical protein